MTEEKKPGWVEKVWGGKHVEKTRINFPAARRF